MPTHKRTQRWPRHALSASLFGPCTARMLYAPPPARRRGRSSIPGLSEPAYTHARFCMRGRAEGRPCRDLQIEGNNGVRRVLSALLQTLSRLLKRRFVHGCHSLFPGPCWHGRTLLHVPVGMQTHATSPASMCRPAHTRRHACRQPSATRSGGCHGSCVPARRPCTVLAAERPA